MSTIIKQPGSNKAKYEHSSDPKAYALFHCACPNRLPAKWLPILENGKKENNLHSASENMALVSYIMRIIQELCR